ncbi:hypothetical protein LTR05_001166 [Lithohypha guttulata]|uniref:Uncharacterized protein n=1 Tax=Lithohypha guttulata TaxID=1690604 RepID=A0AAN7YA48_9EURO|nr:hypothetical protein LTR05_001166 [Lithohypha guttulata]
MVNVPHEPEMTNVHQFRRLFTQSPACPHESTPIGAYALNTGSPILSRKKSTSIHRLSQHIRQKLSESRLSKSSSRVEYQDEDDDKIARKVLEPIIDGDAVVLGISAGSTGLSDLLRSGETNANGYDSDAQSIRTPHLRNTFDTLEASPVYARQYTDDVELRPDDSMSNYSPSPRQAAPRAETSPGSKANDHSINHPTSPVKAVSNSALPTRSSGSPSAASERFIKGLTRCTTEQLTTNRGGRTESADSRGTDVTSKLSLQYPRSSSLGRVPETPETIVKKLSDSPNSHTRASARTSASTSKPDKLSKQLDPGLLDYLARKSPSRLSSEVAREATSPKTAIPDEESSLVTHKDDKASYNASKLSSYEQSRTDVASIISEVPSEHSKSVHLFNMHISQRLASKSTAMMLSPSASPHTSRKSLDASLIHPCSLASGTVTQMPTRLRAEHNRKPSDPHTRCLFEQPAQAAAVKWTRRSTSTDRTKLASSDRDDASSYYTHDGGPPSGAGHFSSLDGTTSILRNPNSIAIGGRAASSELPVQHAGREALLPLEPTPSRSLSASTADRSNALEAASKVIHRYIESDAEADIASIERVLPAEPNEAKQASDQDCGDRGSTKLDSSVTQVNSSSARRLSAGWLTDGQRHGWNYNFVDVATPTQRRNSAIAMVASEASPLCITESATDMWNRAFRDAHETGAARDLLSMPPIELDYLRRPSSLNTIRPKHRSSLHIQTPDAEIRRSQSAGPYARADQQQEQQSEKLKTSHLLRTLKRLSFPQLRASRLPVSQGSRPRKLQKRSSPELSSKSSFATLKVTNGASNRVGNTPPVKELLGIWASFPSHQYWTRNGPASEQDDVYVRDFGEESSEHKVSDIPNTPILNRRTSTGALFAMQSTLRMLSIRSKRLDRKRTKSMSFPTDVSDRFRKSSKILFLNRWRRLYRTKSTEWQGYMTDKGYRSNISASRSVEFPELKTLPGEGLFGGSPGQHDVSSAAARKTSPAMDDSNNMGKQILSDVTRRERPASEDKENIRWLKTSDSSLWEPVLGYDEKFNETSDMPQSDTANNEASCQVNPIFKESSTLEDQTSRSHGVSRSSEDLQIPGSWRIAD